MSLQIKKVVALETASLRFGTNEKELTRRELLRNLMLGGAGLFVAASPLSKVLNADEFIKTTSVLPQFDVSEAERKLATEQFDKLIDNFYDRPARSEKAFQNYKDSLEQINFKHLDNKYQGLHMLFDNYLQRQLFLFKEGPSFYKLGIDCNKISTVASDSSIDINKDRTADPEKNLLPPEFEIVEKPSDELLSSGGIGKKRYDALLKLKQFIDFDSDSLLDVAKERYQSIETEMKKIAANINPDKDWRELYRELCKLHPQKNELLFVYRDEVNRAKSFLKDLNIINLPPERLEVKETPRNLRDSVPFAAYMKGNNNSGTFIVTTILDTDPDKIEEQLQIHNIFFIPPVVVHEAFPGHHLQHVHDIFANIDRSDPKNKTLLRVLNLTDKSSSFAEGWGLYSETLMKESKYFTPSDDFISQWKHLLIPAAKQLLDPKIASSKNEEQAIKYLAENAQQLFALRNILWRAARAMIDPQIHTGGMKYDEPVKFLVDNILLDKDRAEIEVDRYFQRPTEVVGYIMGHMQIQQLREQVKKAENNKFDLKAFHDRLLSGQELPVKVLAKMQFDQDLKLSPVNNSDKSF